MGNEEFCSNDTRDLRNSTVINIVNQVPVVRGSFNFKSQETFKKIENAAVKFCQQSNLDAQYIPTVARIIAYRHDNLFQAYRRLPQQQREQFMDQLTYVDIELMDSLYYNFVKQKRQNMMAKDLPTRVPYIDVQTLPREKIEACITKGKTLIAEKKVGLVLMCAGASMRFFGQDKFLCPLETPDKKCILQLMMERAIRNIRSSGNSQLSIPIIICCNENNRNIIQSFLSKHNYFGFNTGKIRFVQIFNLPILNVEGKFCTSFQYKILSRPAGTGKCLQEVLGDQLYGFLKKESVKYLHFCGVENFMENPLDPFFIGIVNQEKRDICGKSVSPVFEAQNFNRYVSDRKKRIMLMDMQTLSGFNKFKLLVESPIAMNSLVCDIESTKQAIKQFNNNMFLSKQYRLIECQTDYFDFKKEKPLIKQKCFMFEKDIGDVLTVCSKPLVLKVPRYEFIPLISKSDEYSLKTGSQKMMQLIQSRVNTMNGGLKTVYDS